MSTHHADESILPGSKLTYRQLAQPATRGINQDAIDDTAEIMRLLPPLSVNAQREVGKAALRFSSSTRAELIEGLKL